MTRDTRQRILDAALECFTESGYEHATVAQIRRRAEVSNGTFFHRFPTKEAVAEALYVEAIESYQDGLWTILRRRPRTLRGALRSVIAHQLTWVELNADLARFVYGRGHLDGASQGAAAVTALNTELGDAFGGWMEPFLRRGELRVDSMLLITAIVNGPAHAIARRWLAGQLPASPTGYVEALSDAAYGALCGEPAEATLAGPPAPRALVTVELLDADGRVGAGGAQQLELKPRKRRAGAKEQR